ncbi:MAG: hypothetical protein RIQ53_1798 [Pseudomonadota bacterium]|jgi:3-phenylpropionate/trans-cinnamate dioxygenase ferredoxin reductase subunit
MPETSTAAAGRPPPIIVVGGGHAGVQLVAALADAGASAGVQLVCDELWAPYQRPPLSKQFLRDERLDLNPLRPERWYLERGVELLAGDEAVQIDRQHRSLRLGSGRVLPWSRLVLATGARARRLPGLHDGLENVHTLRQAADAQRLRHALAHADELTVIGGGFIGLEVAASARLMGRRVRVIETRARLLSRSVSPALADHALQHHRAQGIEVHLGAVVSAWEHDEHRLQAVIVDGRRLPVDQLVLGVGALPRTQLAQDAGLACGDGVLVDACLRSSDPAILAIGDCARCTPADGGSPLRLESIQNAQDQARVAAATLLGDPRPYRPQPSFWSEQGALRLQMSGLLPAGGTGEPPVRSVRRPLAGGDGFSLLHYAGDQLVCVESANAPMDHMIARKLLEAGRTVAPQAAADPQQRLHDWL